MMKHIKLYEDYKSIIRDLDILEIKDEIEYFNIIVQDHSNGKHSGYGNYKPNDEYKLALNWNDKCKEKILKVEGKMYIFSNRISFLMIIEFSGNKTITLEEGIIEIKKPGGVKARAIDGYLKDGIVRGQGILEVSLAMILRAFPSDFFCKS